MSTNAQKRAAKINNEEIPSRHEWAVNIYEKGTVTREGKFKTWQDAERYAKWKIKEQLKVPTFTLVEVCHVEGGVDVPVIRLMPVGVVNFDQLVWIHTERNKPWFEGAYN